ncbi:hypothetical protein [uncultured Roseobacter sp.]|uniref:hypothetical protein n=1 Tax=uncultured Roseobacter sp. TaxID=114847 RepID=UPI00262BB114|nr:hypothetical protein [uncultured Roseobacter sp.]
MTGRGAQSPLAAAWRWLCASLSGAVSALTAGNIPWIGNVAGLIAILTALGGAVFYAVSLLSAPDVAQPDLPVPDAPRAWAEAADLLLTTPAVPDETDPRPAPIDPSQRAAPVEPTAGQPELPADRSPAEPAAAVAPHSRAEAPDAATPPAVTPVTLTQGIPRPFPRLPYTVPSCSGGPRVQIDRSDLDSASRGALKVFGTVAETLPVKVAENCWIRDIHYTNINRHNSGGTIFFSREETNP